jgi:RND superfamily putative drug exporter
VAACASRVAETSGDGLEAGRHRPAGFTTDLSAAFAASTGCCSRRVRRRLRHPRDRLPIAAAAVIVLGTSLTALCRACSRSSRSRAPTCSCQRTDQGILFILVIGAATDYSLLYIARYREACTPRSQVGCHVGRAARSWEPILASAAR